MDCFFKNVNRIRCNSFLRCEGIYKVCKEMGTTENFAQNYSKYILKLSIMHKLRDKERDYQIKGLISRFKHFLIKSIYFLFRKGFRDIYHLEGFLDKIESEIVNLEKSKERLDPMRYFKKSGNAYGLIFKYASLNAKIEKDEITNYWKFGNLIGTLVSLNDSIKDLKKDRENNQYNPFKEWKKEEIVRFYKQHNAQIKKELQKVAISNEINDNLTLKPLEVRTNNIASMLKHSVSASLLTFPVNALLINSESGGNEVCNQFMTENICCICTVVGVIVCLGAGCLYGLDRAGLDCY